MRLLRGISLLIAMLQGGLFAATVDGTVVVKTPRGPARDQSGVVAYLVPVSPRGAALPQRNAKLTQKDKHFIPHLLVVTVGSVVEFPNKDPFFHNVFSVYNGTRFDLGLYESGSSKAVTFTRPGPSYLFCNIHPEMSAVILALQTQYFATTDAQGNFRIADVPAGEYELKFWYERSTDQALAALARRITVPDTDLRLSAMDLVQAPSLAEGHKDKYGHDYETGSPYKVP